MFFYKQVRCEPSPLKVALRLGKHVVSIQIMTKCRNCCINALVDRYSHTMSAADTTVHTHAHNHAPPPPPNTHTITYHLHSPTHTHTPITVCSWLAAPDQRTHSRNTPPTLTHANTTRCVFLSCCSLYIGTSIHMRLIRHTDVRCICINVHIYIYTCV